MHVSFDDKYIKICLLSDCQKALGFHLILLLVTEMSGELLTLWIADYIWPDSVSSLWCPKVLHRRAGKLQSFVPQETLSLSAPVCVCDSFSLPQPGHRIPPLSQPVPVRTAPLITFSDFSNLYWQFRSYGERSLKKRLPFDVSLSLLHFLLVSLPPLLKKQIPSLMPH